MKKTHCWSVYFHKPINLVALPHITNMGGSLINTPLYYHDAKVRSDKPHYVFQYTLAGVGCFRKGDKVYEVKAGQGFLCNTGDTEIAYFYPRDAKEPYELIFWCFGGESLLFEEICDKFGPIFELSEDSASLMRGKRYRLKTIDSQRIIHHSCSESIAIASELIADLVASAEAEKELVETAKVTESVRRIVQENIERKFSVSELASMLELSRGHLTKLFKEEVGMSPAKFIEAKRMEYAGKLLKTTNLTINEVAFRMGYELSSHFVRAFKRVMGQTPGRFRQ